MDRITPSKPYLRETENCPGSLAAASHAASANAKVLLPSFYAPDIRNIRAPLQIFGDRVKVDKESREKQDWDGSDGSNKCGDLGWDEKYVLSWQEEIFKVTTCCTCSEVEAAPTSRPSDWATRAVQVDRAMKSRYRLTSGGCSVIQYTILQYMMGQITWHTVDSIKPHWSKQPRFSPVVP